MNSWQAHSPYLKYRADIDGLRALAIIAVIVNHYFAAILPSGYLGVDIFFVISGYVITSTLANREHLSFSDFILGFYQRRIRRLLPALVLYVFITTLVCFLFIPPTSEYYKSSWKTGITALFGISNLRLYQESVDYFGQVAEFNPFTHTWSLGVEEQFYLIFPLMVWWAGFSRQKPTGAKNLFYAIAMVSIISAILFVWLARKGDPASYFMITSRFWELGTGCLVYLLVHKQASLINKFRSPNIVFAALVASLFIPAIYHIKATALVVLLTALLIAFLAPSSFVYQILVLPPIVFVGTISYSLYLWHWGVLVISRWTTGIYWWLFPVQVGLTLMLAILSYKYIENPLRHANWAPSQGETIVKGAAISLVCAGLLAILGGSLNGMLYLGTQDKATYLKRHEHSLIKGVSFTPEFSQTYGTAMEKAPECNMTPHHLNMNDRNYRNKPVVDHDFIHGCLAGVRPKLILIGDSFAQVISAHVAFAAKEMGLEFRLIFGYGCPYPLNLRNISHAALTTCEIDPVSLKSELLKEINPGDVVVLRLYFQKLSYLNLQEDGSDLVQAYDSEIEGLYHEIHSRGGSLLLIGSNPSLPSNPVCANPQWFNSLQQDTCAATYQNNYAVNHDLYLLKRYTGKYPGFEIVSPTRILCGRDFFNCNKELEKSGLFSSDGTHVNDIAVDLIYPDIVSSLRRMTGQEAWPSRRGS